jgi:hypothetical protein
VVLESASIAEPTHSLSGYTCVVLLDLGR